MMSPPATPTEVCAPSRARRLCRHRPRGWSCGIRSGGRRPRSARGGTGSIGIGSPSRSSRRTRRSTRLPWRSRAPVPTPTGAAVQIRRNEPPPQARSLSSAAGSSPPLRATASRASRPSRPATYASSCRLSRLNQDLGLPARRLTHMPMSGRSTVGSYEIMRAVSQRRAKACCLDARSDIRAGIADTTSMLAVPWWDMAMLVQIVS